MAAAFWQGSEFLFAYPSGKAINASTSSRSDSVGSGRLNESFTGFRATSCEIGK